MICLINHVQLTMNIIITSPSLNPQNNVSGISSIMKLLVDNNHAHHYTIFVIGKKDNQKRRLKWLLKTASIPLRLLALLRKQKTDIIHFNIGFEPPSLIRDIAPFLTARLLGRKVVLHIHGGRFMTAPAHGLLKKIIHLMLRYTSSIIVLSEAEKTFLCTLNPKLNKKKIYSLPNVVDLPHLEPESLDRKKKPLHIIYLGRIDRKKGLGEIAEALNALSTQDVDFHFSLCGVGPDEEWFDQQLAPTTQTKVEKKGLIYGADKDKVLRQADLFLMPSHFEGLPMALLETMAYGIVPIVTPVGSIPQVVKNGQNGYLIANKNEIVKALVTMHKDREHLHRLSLKAKETIENEFSLDLYIARINQIYKELQA